MPCNCALPPAPAIYEAALHLETLACVCRYGCLKLMVRAGDVERATELVFNSRGIQRARDLAAQHAELAVQAVSLIAMLRVPSLWSAESPFLVFMSSVLQGEGLCAALTSLWMARKS